VPTFIGEGIPLLAQRHRAVTLRLLGVQQFPEVSFSCNTRCSGRACEPAIRWGRRVIRPGVQARTDLKAFTRR
jgi:hypothetical protein